MALLDSSLFWCRANEEEVLEDQLRYMKLCIENGTVGLFSVLVQPPSGSQAGYASEEEMLEDEQQPSQPQAEASSARQIPASRVQA